MKSQSQVLSLLAVLLLVPAAESFALSENDFHLIASQYAVPANLLRAISLIETQEGKILGKYEVYIVIDATQMKYLKKIARHTGRSLKEFKGSSAGAMGYMQFIPSTFYTYAQDGNGDGIKDPLSSYDSLATAAHFLAHYLAKDKGLNAALRRYNNSSAYCRKVLHLYQKLESERIFAWYLADGVLQDKNDSTL